MTLGANSIVNGRSCAARLARTCSLVIALALACFTAATAQAEYRLDTGDRVRITVLEQPTLSGEFNVGPTATLSLPLIGRLNARGLTPDALESAIAERLARIGGLKDPKVNVEIVAFRPFYILGAVEAPGQYPYVVDMTVLHAISLAGGFRRPVATEVGNEMDIARLRERHQTLGDSLASALARRARLVAERDDAPSIVVDDSMRNLTSDMRVTEILANEQRIREHRAESIRNESAMLANQKSIISEEIAALEGQLVAKLRLAEINQQEMGEIDKLRQRDLIPITRVLALRRAATEIESDRIQLLAAIARARQEMTKVDINLATLRRARSIQVAESLKQADDDVAQFSLSRAGATEQLRHGELLQGRASTMHRPDDTGSELVILRRTKQGIEEIKANDLTAVFPGDLIKVPARAMGDAASPSGLPTR